LDRNYGKENSEFRSALGKKLTGISRGGGGRRYPKKFFKGLEIPKSLKREGMPV